MFCDYYYYFLNIYFILLFALLEARHDTRVMSVRTSAWCDSATPLTNGAGEIESPSSFCQPRPLNPVLHLFNTPTHDYAYRADIHAKHVAFEDLGSL